MAKRKYSSPYPYPTDDSHPFAWKNLVTTLDPANFNDAADQAAWCLARRHNIPPWEAAEKLKGYRHDA